MGGCNFVGTARFCRISTTTISTRHQHFGYNWGSSIRSWGARDRLGSKEGHQTRKQILIILLFFFLPFISSSVNLPPSVVSSLSVSTLREVVKFALRNPTKLARIYASPYLLTVSIGLSLYEELRQGNRGIEAIDTGGHFFFSCHYRINNPYCYRGGSCNYDSLEVGYSSAYKSCYTGRCHECILGYEAPNWETCHRWIETARKYCLCVYGGLCNVKVNIDVVKVEKVGETNKVVEADITVGNEDAEKLKRWVEQVFQDASNEVDTGPNETARTDATVEETQTGQTEANDNMTSYSVSTNEEATTVNIQTEEGELTIDTKLPDIDKKELDIETPNFNSLVKFNLEDLACKLEGDWAWGHISLDFCPYQDVLEKFGTLILGLSYLIGLFLVIRI